MAHPMKLVLGLVVVVAAGGIAASFALLPSGSSPVGLRVSGNIEVTDAEVGFKIPGRVEERLVDEGVKVKQGEVVAKLDDADLREEVALRHAELAAAEAAWAELKAGSRPQEIAAAKASLDKAEAALKELETGNRPQEIAVGEATLKAATVDAQRLETEMARAERLAKGNAMSQEDYDRARSAYNVAAQRAREAAERLDLLREGARQEQIDQARAARDQLKAQYELIKIGPRQEQIAQAAARVQQAQASLRLTETRLGYATLVSPLEGVVLSKNIEPGEYVSPGTPVITVGDLVNVWLRAYINETDMGRVNPGQKATVTTDTYPGKKYEGRVSFISDKAEFTPKSVQTQAERVKLVYRIKIDIQNPAMELKPGMPADATIELRTKDEGLRTKD
ncbi:MAG: efflux RND transporter periplasmic adaptor subunit [Thermoguttaceae bacterium]|jgi:HlyD family secretion protein